jgi:hypothetical protein
MEPSQGEERKKKERKKERRKKERGSRDSWWASHAEGTGVIESHHVRKCDSSGMTPSTWQGV